MKLTEAARQQQQQFKRLFGQTYDLLVSVKDETVTDEQIVSLKNQTEFPIMTPVWSFIYMLLVCLLVQNSVSRSGIDLSASISSQKWIDNIGITQFADAFAILHGVFHNNTINTPIVQTIQSGWSVGVRDISLYIYPCIQTSPYAINNQISCGTAKQQIDRLISFLYIRGIEFRSYNWSAYDVVYDRNIPTWNTSAKNTNITLQTLYINVEDNAPNYYFSYNHYENVEVLNEMRLYAEQHKGIEVGIYTTPTDWNNIMTDYLNNTTTHPRVYNYANGTKYNETNPFAKHKLWLPRYDLITNFNFFTPFADWPEVYIKQISGGSKDQRRVGSSRICLNYIEDLTNGTLPITVPLFGSR